MSRAAAPTSPRLGKALSERDQACFECELPECQEDSEGCKYHHRGKADLTPAYAGLDTTEELTENRGERR